MNIHLIKTENYLTEDFNQVFELLTSTSFRGNMEFSKNYMYEIQNNDNILGWNTIWDLCKTYRSRANISVEDIVVLLTEKPNELNWFSAFDNKKNIFVHTDEWNLFVKCEPKYPIVYEIVANILQSIMQLKEDDKYIHNITIGCVNDFCLHKPDIILKLRTGDICEDCIREMQNKQISDTIINQALSIFEGIRKEMLFSLKFRRNSIPSRINVSNTFEIYFQDFNNKKLKLTPLQKSIYLLFLKYGSFDIREKQEEQTNLYRILRPNIDANEAINSISNLYDDFEQGFNEQLSKINKKIKEELVFLDKNLISNYCIINRSINLHKDMITMPQF